MMRYSASMIPPNPTDDARWMEQRRRRRLMTGAWLSDLRARLVREVGAERADAWGIPKQTSNLFGTVHRELSALYLTEPVIRMPDGERLDQATGTPAAFNRALVSSQWFPKMIEFQPLVLGCQEYLWRMHCYADGRISLRPVPADVVEAEPSEDDASQPRRVRELRWRPAVDAWCWDDICAEDESYRVMTYASGDETSTDVTARVLGQDYSGASYPYRTPTGAPILPYELYHACALGDQLWHPLRGIETTEGSLDISVQYTFLGHVMKAASWPQRWSLNAVLSGSETDERYNSIQVDGMSVQANTQRARVVTDPAVLLQFIQPPDSTGQPQIGQFLTSADPVAMESVISAAANRVAVEAGLPPTDIQRMGGTARSGYAISLSNESKRVTARRYAPAFRGPDSRMIAKLAALWSARTGQSLPDGAWDIEYQDLPLSPDELRERRANVIESIGAGLLSRSDGYMELNPGITRQQAQMDLIAIDAERARNAIVTPTPRGF